VLFGAALGNLIRGVPLRGDGMFSLSLFESFSPSGVLGILDWYTVLAGVLALAAILHHGALFLAWKTDATVRERSLRTAGRLFWVVVVLWVLATVATSSIAPGLYPALAARPLGWILTLLAVAGLVVSALGRRAGHDLLAFLGSCAYLLGVLAATATSVYPTMIRSIDPQIPSLTALNASASEASLRVGLYWWPFGFVLAIVYFYILFRVHGGKAQAAAEGEGY
jgi:cytochrome d ubiquinol oxidase subunit II